jgi:Periplasmic component of the Tol biopolymer transport system
MKSRRVLLLAAVSVLLLGLACRYTAPTPAAWAPSSTAELDARTRAAQTTISALEETRSPTNAPTATLTPVPRPTAAEDGPWLIFPDAAGEHLYALDRDSGALITIALPMLTDPLDIIGGRAPDGARVLLRAGTHENLAELGLYELLNPWEPARMLTELLSQELQDAVLQNDGIQAQMALQAVQQPHPISWSSDGNNAVFPAALDGLSADLYLYRPGGSALTRLNQRFQQDFSPLWSPEQDWIVFQEVNSYTTINVWKLSLVGALSMPNGAVTHYMHVPRDTGYWERYVGWMSALYLLTYTPTENGGIDLRLSNVSAGKPRVIFDGAFAEAAVNPQNGDVAVAVRTENNNPRKPAGIYYSSNSGTTFEALLAGEYKNLSYTPENGLFTAASAVGVLQFDRTGSVFMLAGEQRLGIAPDGHWLIGWGGNGARLYSPQGFRLQTLTDQSVSALVWQEDSKGFFLLAQDGLFHFQFPLLQARLVTTDVWRGDEKAFVWLR